MITIYARDTTEPTQVISQDWQIGSGDPKHLYNRRWNIEEIEVSGKELEYILTHFSNLPYRDNALTFHWFDADAKFIIGNIGRADD
jgi:hypothetical protein